MGVLESVVLYKNCYICGEEYEVGSINFSRDKRNSDGFSNRCKPCSAEYMKKYYAMNSEKFKEKARVRREVTHREEILENKKVWWKENRDEGIERLRKRYLENKDYYRQAGYTWRKNNIDKARESQRRVEQRRRARKNGLLTDYTEEQWDHCKKFFNNKCAYCGDTSNIHQDHFVPLSKGGAYTASNVLPACQKCNCSKGNKNFHEWFLFCDSYTEQRLRKIEEYLEGVV